jgi:hypothetical protein
MKIKTYKDRVGNYAPIKTCNNSNIPPPGHNDQIPHPKSKNEVQMPYIAQLSGGQMSHCKSNLKVKILQLPQSILVQPIFENNSHIFYFETLKHAVSCVSGQQVNL